MTHQISVIIPVLNEVENIQKLLIHLLNNATRENLADIIVVDGGSTDGSQNIVRNFVTSSDSDNSESYREGDNKALDIFSQNENTRPDIVLITTDKGRAKQMNAGSKSARGTILYFLHADSFPPRNYDQLIINEIIKGNYAGCFKMQFNNSHLWLRLASWFTQFSWRACRGGDQSQFVTKALFDELGGFDENFIIYEDNDFINKLYARKEFIVIQQTIISSARTYSKNGVWRLQYYFLMIYLKKWFGASAEELHRYYKQHIIT